MSRILGPSGISAPYHEGDPIPRIEIGSDTGAPSRSSTAVPAIPKGPSRPVEYPSPQGPSERMAPFLFSGKPCPGLPNVYQKGASKPWGTRSSFPDIF